LAVDDHVNKVSQNIELEEVRGGHTVTYIIASFTLSRGLALASLSNNSSVTARRVISTPREVMVCGKDARCGNEQFSMSGVRRSW
jgi:hypothetical protein